MSEITPKTATRRPAIKLPDGDILDPRREFARGLGVSDKTAQRMNLPTTYIGGMAYVARNASLKLISDRLRTRKQRPRPRGRS
jgi:hypothetical protein